jgi:hypothetical protein
MYSGNVGIDESNSRQESPLIFRKRLWELIKDFPVMIKLSVIAKNS